MFRSTKIPSLFRTSLALGAFASASLLPNPAFARVALVAHITAAPVNKAQNVSAGGYIKALPGTDGAIGAAQTAIRRFTPLRGTGPSVYLVAAVHIGEKSYYKQLQQFLDRQDVVLFEGVRSSRSAAKLNLARVATPQASSGAKPPGGAKAPVGLYKKVSNALHLQYQLEGIHYDRPQFRNSDLDWDTLNALAIKAGPDTQKRLAELGNSVAGGSPITESEQMLDQVLRLSASTPLVATLLRRMLVIGLCEPEKMRALLGRKPVQSGVLTSTKQLDAIVVNERNKAVLADLNALLQKAKRTPRPIRSIAVFYGAAHMNDIEQHLVSDLGYRATGGRWITAIAAR